MTPLSGSKTILVSGLVRNLAHTLLLVCMLAGLALPAQAVFMVHDFYLPMPEAQVRASLYTLSTATNTTIDSVTSIVVTGSGTVIHYDHWEDGYEVNINAPIQSTSRIWGDGNNANGIPPGYANDPAGLPQGAVISLRNLVPLPRNASNILYDARDRVTASKALVVSRAAWATSPGSVLAGAVEVSATIDYGTSFISPVGQDVSAASMFEYVGLFVMAAENNTAVTVDVDGPGVALPVNIVLNRGESYHLNGGILRGATVTASKPVQAQIITGDVGANYESRWYTLYPTEQWYGSYATPVGTAANGQQCYVFVYNPDASPLSINYTTRVGSGSFNVPANGVYQWQVPQNSGARLASPNGEPFFALSTVGANPTSNNVYDWGFTLVPEDALSTQAVVGWGPGSSDLSQNGSPVWVSPVAATRVYVDYNGDGNGLLTDPSGGKYDAHYDLQAFESKTVYDPDKDQTAMRVYTLSGIVFATAWGQDPAVAAPGNPYLDLGTTVLPIPLPVIRKSSSILVDNGTPGLSIGDILEYTIELDNKGLLPLGNTLVVDALPPALSYQANTTEWNGNPIPDDGVGSTIFPLDETGYTIPIILRGGTSTFHYHVQIVGSGTIRNTANAGGYGLFYDHEIEVPPPAGSNQCSLEFTDAGGTPAGAYSANDDIYVRLSDPDANVNSLVAETMSLVVTNDTNGDLETVTLIETGPATAVFQSASALPSSTSTGLGTEDGVLHAQPGHALSVVYVDPLFGDSCSDSINISVPTETKVLYLTTDGADGDLTGGSDRIDPVATSDGTTSQTAVMNESSPVVLDAFSGTPASGTLVASVTPVFDAATSAATSSTTHTFSHTTGTGPNRLLLVGVTVQDNNVTVSSITYGGTALTSVGTGTRGSGGSRLHMALYRLVNPPSGANDVVVTFSSTFQSGKGAVIGASTYSNVNQTTPLGTFVTANGSSTAPSVTATAVVGDLVYDTVASAVTGTTLTLPGGNGQTQRWQNVSGTVVRGAASTETAAAASVVMNWTSGNGNWVTGAVAIKAGPSTLSLSHTTGSGTNRLMLVGVSYEDDNENGCAVSSVTYGGQSLTQVVWRAQNEAISEIWGLTAPPSGAGTVVVSFTGTETADSAVVGVATFTGVDQTTPLGTPASAQVNGTSLSVNVVSETGGMVFDTLAVDDGRVSTVNAGQTQRWNARTESGDDGIRGAASTKPGAASVNTGWTWVNTDWAALCAVPIRPAPPVSVTASFTQTPAFCANMTMPAGGTVNVVAHANVTSGSMPGSPTITARLKYGATTFFESTTATWNGGAGTLSWSGALASNYTVPTGQAIVLEVAPNLAGVAFRLEYDSQTKPSRVSLPTNSVISIDTLGVFDAPYPGGLPVAGATTGSTLYIRASVSDPFGAYDITDLDLAVTGPGGMGNFSLTLDDADVVAATSCAKVYEYAWVTSAPVGAYEILATANEGTEGITDTATASVVLSFLDLGTPSVTEFTIGDNGPHTEIYNPDQTVCVRVTDLDQNTNPAAVETVLAVITTSSGDTETVTLTETGVDTGVFTTCLSASATVDGGDGDGTLYAPTGTLLNVAYTDPDDPTDQSGDTATVPLPSGTPGIVVTKTLVTPADGQTMVGGAVQYTVQVVNVGDVNLPNVSLVDTFPAVNLSYVSASPAPDTVGAGTLTWNNIGPLAGAQSKSFTVNFTALASAAPAVNNVVADAGGGIDDSDAAGVVITNPSLSVTKTLVSPNPGPAAYGANVVFQVEVENTGDTDIETLPLEDTFSMAYFQYVSADIVPDSVAMGSLLWLDLTGPGSLAPGNSVVVEITLKVVGAGNPAINTASADFAEDEYGDPVPPSSDSASLVTLAASISGTVYNDLNQSGGFNAGEPGLSGVTLYLYTDPDGDGDPGDGVLVEVTATSGGGYYEFVNLPVGKYVVVQTDLSGYASSGDTAGANDNRIPVDVTASIAYTDNDFFDYLLLPASYATITGTVWDDLNGNASFDLGEVGIGGVTVELVSDVNGNGVADVGEPVVAAANTNAGGVYVFGGLAPGNYVVRETTPVGYLSSGDTAGANDDQIGVSVLAGQTSANNDFFDWVVVSISLTKTALTADYDEPGDVIAYAFTVVNDGSVQLSNITLADTVGGVTVSGGPIASLAPGGIDTATFTASYTVTQSDVDAGSFTNTATVTGLDPNLAPVTDDDDETVMAVQTPSILLTKTATTADYDAVGDVLSYTFTVENTGNVTLTNVTLADTVGGVTVSGGPIAVLAPGAVDTATFTATYTATQSDVDAGS
ncbi:MAG: DUF11 domain-containing protein, partial [Candidatus Hydrogenedentes bacterium]|nr:DUF11 domain-containing protein [Candidatus Hydrogenedentota bacterium]